MTEEETVKSKGKTQRKQESDFSSEMIHTESNQRQRQSYAAMTGIAGALYYRKIHRHSTYYQFKNANRLDKR